MKLRFLKKVVEAYREWSQIGRRICLGVYLLLTICCFVSMYSDEVYHSSSIVDTIAVFTILLVFAAILAALIVGTFILCYCMSETKEGRSVFITAACWSVGMFIGRVSCPTLDIPSMFYSYGTITTLCFNINYFLMCAVMMTFIKSTIESILLEI